MTIMLFKVDDCVICLMSGILLSLYGIGIVLKSLHYIQKGCNTQLHDSSGTRTVKVKDH